MSNYLSIKLGYIHEENEEELRRVTKLLASVGLLDGDSQLHNNGGYEEEKGTMAEIFQTARRREMKKKMSR